jgi:hypothetical protein
MQTSHRCCIEPMIVPIIGTIVPQNRVVDAATSWSAYATIPVQEV